LGLFLNNTFKKKVELFKVNQSFIGLLVMSGLLVITCLDSIEKKKFKIIETMCVWGFTA